MALDHGRKIFIVLLKHFLQNSVTAGQKCLDGLVVWCGKIAVILQNCKLLEIALGLIGAAFITSEPHNPGGTTYEAVLKKKEHKKGTVLWTHTHRIQAAGTRCYCNRALDHWRRTGYWGSCGSAGLPCYMR